MGGSEGGRNETSRNCIVVKRKIAAGAEMDEKPVATNRPRYRSGNKETAVKAYTINQESRLVVLHHPLTTRPHPTPHGVIDIDTLSLLISLYLLSIIHITHGGTHYNTT